MTDASIPRESARRSMLLTGATGFIGARLATAALERGYDVRTLTRGDWSSAPWISTSQRYFGSLPSQIPDTLCDGIDVVVHCAADVAGAGRQAAAVNVEGTRRLAELARISGVKTFIFISSQSARADAPAAYGQTKYAAERALRAVDGLRSIILRPGVVTGPGGKGLFGRMVRMVKTLPVLPLLDGGRALVQPIHVDDLCEAIFRADERADVLAGATLNLGDSQGCTLAEFLALIAESLTPGQPKRTVTVPLGPIQTAVGLAEKVGAKLPVNSNNLRGMRQVERMDTAASLARLGLTLRPLAATVDTSAEPRPADASLAERAVRVILVGAGRIGLVHAVTLSRLHGVTLAGVVDRAPAATKLFQGMGITAPCFADLNEAIEKVRPDAALIATPPATHLPLAKLCLEAGLAVMVEKPLAVRDEQLNEMAALASQYPGCPIQVGYVMPRNPQIAACVERLRAGEYGRVLGFAGFTLISLIQAPTGSRWEVKPEVSGGGALINAGGHVLSMIQAAFGKPDAVTSEQARIYSEDVEDTVVARFQYPEFSGVQFCSWSIDGFPRQENNLVIWTERGTLTLTGSVGVFVASDGATEITHQLQFDVGFNLAPDYAGAGFTTELQDLAEAARTRQPAPMSLDVASGVERLLFDVYRQAKSVSRFKADAEVQSPAPAAALRLVGSSADASGSASPARRLLDLRDVADDEARAFLATADGSDRWDGYLMTAPQCGGLDRLPQTRARPRVTAPDFLNEARMLSNRRYADVLKMMGVTGLLRAGLLGGPLAVAQRGATFWVAAAALLAADLEKLPKSYDGTILLHPYLTDFALALRRLDMLERLVSACHAARPHARVGFHTNMAADAINALSLLESRVDEVAILSAPGAHGMAETVAALKQAGGDSGRTVLVEVGLAPSFVHRVATESPGAWTFGADAIVVGAQADPEVARRRRQEVRQAWSKAFPGLEMPELVL